MPDWMEQRHREYLALAIGQAEQGMRAGRGGPFGAVVAKDGSIVAQASNAVIQSLDPTAHAEIQAVRMACQRIGAFALTDCDVYASCEPCPMCLFALCWARPRAVYYAATRLDAAAVGFDDERLYAVCSLDPMGLPFQYRRIVVPNARAPFAEYAQLDQRIPY